MKTLFTEIQVKERVSELAHLISRDCKPKKLHVLFVLKGSFVFCADLVRELSRQNIDVKIDYIIAKSYLGKESTGDVRHSVSEEIAIYGEDVLLVEDIIDTGNTIKKLKDVLSKKSPKTLKVACFLDKPSRRKVQMGADYVGFEIPDRFVVGYGLDHDERYRALPYIAEID